MGWVLNKADDNPADDLGGIGTIKCDQWRRAILLRHRSFGRSLAWRYKETARRHGYVKANAELAQAEKLLKIGRTGLFADQSDSDFVDYARVKSARLEQDFLQWGRRLSVIAAVDCLINEMARTGVAFPMDVEGVDFALLKKTVSADDWEDIKKRLLAACARCFCERWWRRQIRKMAARQCETVARSLGLVSRKKGGYCSDFRMSRRQGQQARNRHLLENLEAENQDGYKATLAELSDSSVSNPSNRHGELMTRIRGFEEVAVELGFVGLFFTLTCPSKYHAVLSSGYRNSKFKGFTPSEAQAYLSKQWAKIRAKWARQGVRCFGFRVAEPHHDGTPHWHLMLFFMPDQIAKARSLFMKYALEVDGHENGAIDNRADCKVIDPAKGTAAGYIAKYISKNIAGHGNCAADWDHETGDLWSNSAARVDAWASCWGIRQFQQIGVVSVTVWRELRRLKQPESFDPDELKALIAACDCGDWAEFVRLMGGPLVERDCQPLRPWLESVEGENRYGEIAERLKGVILRGAWRALTKLHTWTVTAKQNEDKKLIEDAAFIAAKMRGWSASMEYKARYSGL